MTDYNPKVEINMHKMPDILMQKNFNRMKKLDHIKNIYLK